MFPWGGFPFSKDMMKNMKPEMIEQYVMDAIKNYMPQGGETGTIFSNNQSESPEQSSRRNIQVNIFETHEFVFARFPVKPEWLDEMRIFHTSTELIIENIPEAGNSESFTLPVPVRKKGVTAAAVDGILEIKFLRSLHTHLSEIQIER
ncbi:hypothetical protein A8F94_02775 [Bacillus sp. FJAT-27225]|uniref:hypothetical protein n=1 Tax=Bacillus sp. FJAT-27225 TaxID=1743144 RepID=UPI00080C2AA6|nr:hypothetical protein [Bacillus sp. FJAT-27225]OCA90816.1 hypothetical protein A8F94_02775 [Bacillus sp. FJAT-27225]